jgi:AcrR family transcriptional regulator
MPAKIKTSPRKAPKQERAQATVEALMTATARILVQVGYDRASTNRIAEEAGISIGSLYQYFPNKESLVAELVERQMHEEMEVLSRVLPALRGGPLREGVRQLLGAMLEIHRRDPALRRIIIEQVPRVGRLEKMLDLQSQVAEIIRTHLAERCEEIRPRDLDMAAFVLVHSVEAVIHGAVYKRPEYLGRERFVDELTELVVKYLGA